MTHSAYVAIGGTEDCRGGAEVFMTRLKSLWPATGLGDLVTAPANTAWAKSAQRVPGSMWRWLRTTAQTTRLVWHHARKNGHVSLWYHYSNGVDLLAVLWFSLLPGVRVYVTPHCSLTWRHLSSPIGRWITLRVLRRAAALLVLSEEQRQFFAASGTHVRRIRTLLASDSSSSCPAFKTRPPRSIVFVGRVSREKGVPEMLAVLKRLRERSPDFILDLVGPIDDEMTQLLHSECAANPMLSNAIRVHGNVSPWRVREELCRHRYLLHLSKVDAFPLSVLEAITAGAYPVTLALPGTREIIDAWGGIAAHTADPESIAESIWAIEVASRAPDLRSREAAEYYSEREVARDIRLSLEASHAADQDA